MVEINLFDMFCGTLLVEVNLFDMICGTLYSNICMGEYFL